MKPFQSRTKRMHRKLMTLLSRLGINDDERHLLIYHYTNGRTDSSRELTESELSGLLSRLDGQYNERLRQLRSEILTIATRTGIHDPADWNKFNRFMLTRSIYKKPLNEYSYKELLQLRRQFRGIEYHNARSMKKLTPMYWKKHGLSPSDN